MLTLPSLLFVLVLACPGLASAKDTARVDAVLRIFDDWVAQKHAEATKFPKDIANKGWVKTRLSQMVEVDQYARKFGDTPLRGEFNPADETRFKLELGQRMATIDKANTTELKDLIKHHGWIKISVFGAQADNDAWLLVQHADRDPAFQREVLAILETLFAKGETSKRNYAYLYDRVASSFGDLSKRKLQRYGTQGHCVAKGVWEPWPVEDPKGLDARRAEVGLEPEADYIKVFKDICRGKDG